jgi:hypothetical protein
MRVSFLGDVSLNNRYNILYDKNRKPFNNISESLSRSDYVVGNLECLSEGTKENILKRPRLKTNKNTLNYLSDINLNIATLAHNHVYDNCREGFEITTNVLNNLNVNYLGASIDQKDSQKPYIINNDNKIALLNYVTHDTNPKTPHNADVYLNYFDLDRSCEEIRILKKQTRLVFVILHWGGRSEGGYFPDWDQPKIARQLIDSGADLIVGHHSHTLQPYEIYRGKYIFYSLGNFCFDDIIFEGNTIEINKPSGTESAILNVIINKDSEINIELVPINKNPDLELYFDRNILKKFKWRQILFKLIFSNKLFWHIYYLQFKIFSPMVRYFFGNKRSFFTQVKKLNVKKIKNFLSYIYKTFYKSEK